MKNSPHHLKHQVRKALRGARQIDLKKTTQDEIKLIEKRNAADPGSNHLRPLNKERCRQVLNLFKKHLEREVQANKPHHSKRSTAGDVENETTPHVSYSHISKKTMKGWENANLDKSERVAKKIIRSQHHHERKAA